MTNSEPRIPYLPERIAELAGLATNLWWSWSREGRRLFRTIDLRLWLRSRHNPIEFLQRVDPARLVAASEDPDFLARYDRVCGELDTALSADGTWFRTTFPDEASRPIAYFCAEFGLHSSVPIYSGGLGVLAGDHCKTCSDLGVPLVGVGLLYTMGYFDQRIRSDGWQEDDDDPLDPTITPLTPLLDDAGLPLLVSIPIGGRTLQIGAWQMMAGSVPIYLLDTNLEANDPQDRSLSLKLYAGGPEWRLRQEWVLGVGGVRMLRKLGIDVAAWHANEGHAAFMLVELVRELVADGMPIEEARKAVRSQAVFTTHTPVPAGHDVFTHDQITNCVGTYFEESGLDQDTFFGFGSDPMDEGGSYHMTANAIRLAGRVNGVSELHGDVTRKNWRHMWSERDPDAVPIGHITNGVHVGSWMAYPVMDFLDAQLGTDWGTRLEDPALWPQVLDLDGLQFWRVHARLKERLLEYIREDARRRWRTEWTEPGHLVPAGTLMSPEALTIGFARRFATYKRADLLFDDPDRLRRILTDERRPVQLIFAGKAHPADEPGKRILQRVYDHARDRSFEGRITFLEDHELHLEHRLVQGVDLWLNTPRVPLEACGTSGMKAALNGVPQLGTLDGWWAEGFTGLNGWAIPLGKKDDTDEHDADTVYRLLETEIVPMYFERNESDIPTAWVDRMRHALREALERFTARAMVKHYTTECYIPAIRSEAPVTDPTET